MNICRVHKLKHTHKAHTTTTKVKTKTCIPKNKDTRRVKEVTFAFKTTGFIHNHWLYLQRYSRLKTATTSLFIVESEQNGPCL